MPKGISAISLIRSDASHNVLPIRKMKHESGMIFNHIEFIPKFLQRQTEPVRPTNTNFNLASRYFAAVNSALLSSYGD